MARMQSAFKSAVYQMRVFDEEVRDHFVVEYLYYRTPSNHNGFLVQFGIFNGYYDRFVLQMGHPDTYVDWGSATKLDPQLPDIIKQVLSELGVEFNNGSTD